MSRPPHLRPADLTVSLTSEQTRASNLPPAETSTGKTGPGPSGNSVARRSFATPEWLIGLGLLLLPAIVYANTIFYRFGFRDDYSILRESREAPGTVMRVCTMQGRPIYGLLLENSFRRLAGIDDLCWLRLVAAGLLGALGVATFAALSRLRWDRWTAALTAAFITVLPGAQIVVGWAVAWPLLAALLLGLTAFACAETAFALKRPPARLALWMVGAVLVAASALTYQPNCLFYFVPVAATLWRIRRRSVTWSAAWLARHFLTVGAGLVMAFTVTMVTFANRWVPVSHRVALEHDWLGKLQWFIRSPLQNAFALIALNNDDGSPLVHRTAALCAIVLIAGMVRVGLTRGWRHGAWNAITAALLLGASFCVNFVVADHWPTYRVLLPLSATTAVLLAMALLSLGGRWLARTGMIVLLAVGVWLARRQTFDLIAWPQGVELKLMEQGAEAINPATRPSVFVITPKPADHVTKHVFSDEFGSLSTDSDWAPKEMLKLIMHERFPRDHDIVHRYAFASGRSLPPGKTFDVVIDLRRLREFRPAPPAASAAR
jgi:hypothetical protein